LGGIDEKSALILSEIYGTFAPSIIRMKNLEAAELEKVVENSYRDVNIAFANEIAKICEIYGADAHEVIAAANSQPYSHILNPGLVGGHCIPMDPYYIISDLMDKGYCPRLIKTARDVNEGLFSDIANSLGDDIHKVAIFGLSFKKDVKSFETSHTLKLINLLTERGKSVVVHDPFIADEKFPFDTAVDPYLACLGADCLVVSTAHTAYGTLDLTRIKAAMSGWLVIDIRDTFKPEAVAAAGLKYRGLGRGNCD
jgi:UDP-N-acetyl-D-mannosaminuronic acid dehydrogenase